MEFETKSIYELIDASPLPDSSSTNANMVVHDPCVSRFNSSTQDAVRSLIQKSGFNPIDPAHSKEKTVCCGEGAGVNSLAPSKSEQWQKKRLAETCGEQMVSYCASCSASFSGKSQCYHLLDLIFNRDQSLQGKAPVSTGLTTYFNRLRLKQQLRRQAPETNVCFERKAQPAAIKRRQLITKLTLLTGLILAFIGVRSSGGLDYLGQDKLQALISGYGYLAPLVYMLIYAIAPALFLPGLPIGIVGGILFGPVWGVIYTIVSATAGACLAFLISRYLARDIIQERFESPRWQELNLKVEQSGWKMVALTRLVPLFPFNLLNYAFGLTKIKFSHYCLATAIFMLPGTIAAITLSSSLPDLLKGRIGVPFIIGLALIVTTSLFPLIYRRIKRG